MKEVVKTVYEIYSIIMTSGKTRGCVNHPNNFCYVCGKFTPKAQRKPSTNLVKKVYLVRTKQYFYFALDNQDKSFAPHIACRTILIEWIKGTRYAMPFSVPVVWLEPKDLTDCYCRAYP